MAQKNVKKNRWKTLQHNGIIFPPEYESRGFIVKVRNDSIQPNIAQEEMAYQWAKKKDTPYVQDKTFQANFTKDFAAALGPEYKGLSYEEIDFADAYKIVDMEKDRKDAMTKEERKELATKRKEIREQLKVQYGIAIVDDKKVEVGNYMAEPPGIFIGRGDHPLRGRWKPRIAEKDVTLNMSKNAPIPKGDWKKTVENKEATWLASWTDYLTKKEKYIWLADTSEIKQNMDKAKYLKAEMLAAGIDKILDSIARDMTSEDSKMRNISTVCYLIYRTAMRVGDEKDPDEADTVGATTLRKEHVVKISDSVIELDFLGKDSVRWQETIEIQSTHEKQFRKNIKSIIKDKKPKDEIFDGIKSSHVNAYYSGIVKGLSAKVFRTYSATKVVKKYLSEHMDVKNATQTEKLYQARRANLEAAKRCNHKRTIPKNFAESLQKKKIKKKEAEKKKPWIKTQERLKKIKDSTPKTSLQKKNKTKRLKNIREQLKRQKERHHERVEKMERQINLAEETKDYNLGTSLRNYIDPRVVKAWTDETKTEWEKLYTAALQKKFLWVHNENLKWSEDMKPDNKTNEKVDNDNKNDANSVVVVVVAADAKEISTN